MKKLALTESLLTGHAVIDAEHNKIVALINDCIVAIEDDAIGDDQIHQSLLEVTGEIRRHFRREEKIMEKLGYRDIEKHKSHHDRTLGDFETIFEILSSKVLPVEWVIHTVIHSFLSDVVVPDFNVKKYLLEIKYQS